MKQNREARRSDTRDHLNLQIDLLAEREITKMLQMQVAVCERLGIGGALRDSGTERRHSHRNSGGETEKQNNGAPGR
jgi:uncharacterized membrane protein